MDYKNGMMQIVIMVKESFEALRHEATRPLDLNLCLFQTDPIMSHSAPEPVAEAHQAAFKRLYDIVVRLRSPEGCPWDREQTPLSLRGNLIEETYECIEAIDEQDPVHIKEELGDIFLIVTMLAYMHEQKGLFSTVDVLDELSAKLVRRHPHVFGTVPASSSGEALKNWTKVKVEQEGRQPKDSILDEVSRGLPPFDRAWKLQKKAARAGFDWPDVAGVIAKVKEELAEVEAAISDAAVSGSGKDSLAPDNAAPALPNAALPEAAEKSADAVLEDELGDLLFSVINLCRFLDVEPSVALQKTNIKFTGRFKHVEKRMKESGQEMKAQNLDVMDQYWNEAKDKDF